MLLNHDGAAIQVIFDPVIVMTLPSGLGVFSVMAALLSLTPRPTAIYLCKSIVVTNHSFRRKIKRLDNSLSR
jgi:hypothetical protein